MEITDIELCILVKWTNFFAKISNFQLSERELKFVKKIQEEYLNSE